MTMTNLPFPTAYAAAMHWLNEAAAFAQPPMPAPREATYFAATALAVLRGDEHTDGRLDAALKLHGNLFRMPPRPVRFIGPDEAPAPGDALVVRVPDGELPRPMPPENGFLLDELSFSCRTQNMPPALVCEIIEFALTRSAEDALRLSRLVVSHPDYVARRVKTPRGVPNGAAQEHEWRVALARFHRGEQG